MKQRRRVLGPVLVTLAAIVALSGCGQGRWAAVNITDDEATLMRTDGLQRQGGRVSFTTAALERTPRLLNGQLADYWTARTTVNCKARTYQLGETEAFSAGRQVASDPGDDTSAPLKPGSNEAAEAAYACGSGQPGLTRTKPGGPARLVQLFRKGSIIA